MKINLFKGIRIKFLMIFTASIIMAFICILGLVNLLIWGLGLDYIHLGEENGTYSIIFFVVYGLLMLLFFYLFSRKIINRIKAINKNVNEIKEGNLNINIPVDSNDEIGNLAENINVMAKNLKDLIEKEREVEKIKNEMISSVSHDLRTPLTSLMGYIKLIKGNCGDSQPNSDYVDISEKKCEELKKLIDDLLEYSNVNFEGIKLKKEVVSIKQIVEQVLIDFIPQLENSGMTFNIQSNKEKVFVNVDVPLIIRLFQNIISNSIFYGKEGKRIDINISRKCENVIIKIINYGKAIAQEDLPYIFERFYRCEKSRSSNTGGKGMGLAIAKRIAEIHGGTIKASSNSEETVFEIVLPIYLDNNQVLG
ncbi:sensor histidine kinase [Oceanirhabdus sp. W0125-5]|uniref:sensor histidine kinase n=1 Tax=Oceanirhabdus sp. W0125-5 TaxID=2999116 RepID=UPI0022F32518|nr:HAMP domain-containing sensor histidine kinase [Oceanirhabdus sp. W0125-5]WBW96691.1 HAMP domain-containing sensor histidine kinase [Oceanirhabdus sp. W0125-5]